MLSTPPTFFGKIVSNPVETGHALSLQHQHKILKPTPIGKIAEKMWHEIPNHFPFVRLDEFVVMPNHVHGIIIIDRPADVCGFLVDENGERVKKSLCSDTSPPLETLHATSLHMSIISPKPGELGTIIRSYKSAVTR